MKGQVFILGLCLLVLASGPIPMHAESESNQSGSTSSDTSFEKKPFEQGHTSRKRHQTVIIPDCSIDQAQDSQPGSSSTTITGARFIRLDQVNGTAYLTYEAAGKEIMPELLSFEEQAARKQLDHFPTTKTYEVKLDRGSLPNGMKSGDLVDLKISPRVRHMTNYTFFGGSTGDNADHYSWGQTIAENAGRSSHQVDASVITSVEKSSVTSAKAVPYCIVQHKKRYNCDSRSEYVFSDGTVIATEWKFNPHQLTVQRGALSKDQLALLKDSIAACSFEKMAIVVCCDHPQFDNLLAGRSSNSGDSTCEYIMDARCQAIFFTEKYYNSKIEDRIRKFKPATYSPQNRAAEISLLQKLAELRQSGLHSP